MPQNEPLLPMPTPEEMQEIEKFLSTLSPEELDELAQIGEEIMKTAEKEGRPLFADTPTPAPKPTEKPKEEKKKEETKPASKDASKNGTTELSSKEKTALQKMLSTLVEAISSIRQKATSDEKMLEVIAPLNSQLNDLTYYLNVINYSKHLVRLKDAEFSPLKEGLTKLSSQASDIDDQLVVPELELSKKLSSDEQKERRKKLEEAEGVIKKFMSIIRTAVGEKHLLKDFERLLQKYEPEALKIKQDQEAKAKRAGEQLIKLPTTNTGQVPSVYGSRRPTNSGATQHYTGGKQTGSYSGGGSGYDNYSPSSYSPASGAKNVQPTQAAAKKGTTPPDKKTDTTKKEEDNKKAKANALTDAEKAKTAAEDIKRSLKKINTEIAQRKDRFHDFIDTYLPSATPVVEGVSREMTELFEQASFDLNKVKKDVTSWLNLVNKNTTTAKEYRDQTNKMKEFIKSEIRDADELNAKIKNQKGAIAPGDKKTLHQEHLDQFNTRFDAIIKELDKPL